uniref:Uncharacterized protein n=1 Tax=Arundo donax TaxID=35708 RepID=A0A0A8ZVY7_ARUDO
MTAMSFPEQTTRGSSRKSVTFMPGQ